MIYDPEEARGFEGLISFAVFLLRWALLYFDEAKDWEEGWVLELVRREFFKIVGADSFIHCARFEILFGACKDDLGDIED